MDNTSGDYADEAAESAAHGTDYRSPAPFWATVSRRRFLHLGGVIAGAATVAAGSQAGGITGRRSLAPARTVRAATTRTRM